jgi:uncharacterized membrane protein YbhN (UPF0104 family)
LGITVWDRPGISRFLKLAVSAGLVFVLLFTADVADVVDTIWDSDYRHFTLATAVSFAGMFLAARRWQILLGRFHPGLAYFSLFRLIGLSYFYNFFVPGGVAGDLIRGFKCSTHQLSGIQGMASVVVERIIGLGAFALLGLVGCAFSVEALAAIPAGIWPWVAPVGLMIGACAWFGRKRIGAWSVLSRLSPVGCEKLNLLIDSVCEYSGSRSLAGRALAISVLTAMINIGSFYLLGRAAGSDVGLIHFVVFVPVITVASYLPISYSGLGIRELCFMVLFPQVGMTPGQALAVPILYFGMMMILSLAGGLVFWIPRLIQSPGAVSPDRTVTAPCGCLTASATPSIRSPDDSKRIRRPGSPS